MIIEPKEVRRSALSFEKVAESTHHQIISFKVKGKVFATLNIPENRACLKLNEVDQNVFSTVQKDIIYPAPKVH